LEIDGFKPPLQKVSSPVINSWPKKPKGEKKEGGEKLKTVDFKGSNDVGETPTNHEKESGAGQTNMGGVPLGETNQENKGTVPDRGHTGGWKWAVNLRGQVI